MKAAPSLFAPLLALAAGHAAGEDWARVAAETDEPGFAKRIVEVEPASPAEVAGLNPGDYVYQLGESAVRRLSRRQREHEETVFYCPAGGRKATATLPREAMGVRWVESFRPQLDYLRGEIGTPDPRWDAAAVAALARLESDQPGAEEAWAEAKGLGYPDDELDAFVRAFCAWRLRRRIPAREAYEAVVSEFAVMPHLYAASLEDFAYASGQTDILRALHEFDPDSSCIERSLLEAWEHFDATPLEPRRLLPLAREIRGRDLLPELTVPNGDGEEGRWTRLRNLVSKGSINPVPGRYASVRFAMPEDVHDFHYSVAFRLYVHGYHRRFGSFVRVAAYTGEEEGSAVGSRLLAEIELGRERYSRRDWVSCRGGYDQGKRSVWLGEESIPAEDELEEGAAPAMSRPFRIDIVRIGREIAVYSDGVSYCHLPVDPDHRPVELLFFATGIEVDFDDLQVWKLDE